MPMFNDYHVKIENAIIVWDSVTKPEVTPQGKTKWEMSIVVPPTSPDIQLFEQVATRVLQESQRFKGVLPQNGKWPLSKVAPSTPLAEMFEGFTKINSRTYLGVPDIYIDGVLSQPMQYTPLIFSGQIIDILLSCYEQDAPGNFGICAGLDAFEIKTARQGQPLNIGAGRIDTQSAFGAPQQPPAQQGYAPQQPPAQQGYAPQQPPAHQGYAPQQPPAQQGYAPQQPPAHQGYGFMPPRNPS